jgi:hypothetical protein
VLVPQVIAGPVQNDIRDSHLHYWILAVHRVTSAFRFQPAFILYNGRDVGDFRTDEIRFVVHVSWSDTFPSKDEMKDKSNHREEKDEMNECAG